MLTIEHRPMTAEERTELAKMQEPRPSISFWAWLGIWIVCLLVPWFISLRRDKDVTPVLLFGTILLCLYAVIERWWKQRHKELPSQYQRDLSEERVEVIHVEAKDAVEVEEVEDLGLNFFLDVGDSKLLFLTGQYLYELAYDIGEDEVERPGKFPNRQFEIIRSPQSRHLLGFECKGEPFRPSRTYQVPKGERRFFELKDGQVLTGTIPTLQADLCKFGIRLEPADGE